LLNLLAYCDYCFAFDSIDGLHIACHETGGRLRKGRRILNRIK